MASGYSVSPHQQTGMHHLSDSAAHRSTDGGKAWVLGKGEDAVSDKEVRKFLRIIQETMQQKGIPLGYGARVTEKVAVKRIELEPPREESDNDNNDNTDTNEIIQVINTKGGRYGQTRSPYEPSKGFREGCYNCGRKGHGWRYCPDR